MWQVAEREGERTVSLSHSSSETEIASLGLRGETFALVTRTQQQPGCLTVRSSPSSLRLPPPWLPSLCLCLMPFTNCIRLKRDKTRDARSLGMISTYLHLQKGQPNGERRARGAGQGRRPVHGLVIFSTPCTFYKTQHSRRRREREGEKGACRTWLISN